MKSIPKLIRRFVSLLILSSFLFITVNIAALILIGRTRTASGSPYTTAKEIAQSLQMTEIGYSLDSEYLKQLEQNNVWAILIDDKTHVVIWNTDNLPT